MRTYVRKSDTRKVSVFIFLQALTEVALVFLVCLSFFALLQPAYGEAKSGALDTSFGNRGKVYTAIQTSNDRAKAIAVQRDGKLIVAGDSEASLFKAHFAVARYLPNGRLDPTFGNRGKVITPVGVPGFFQLGHANAVIIQQDGKIVVGGSSNSSNGWDFTLVRYEQDGRLDESFGRGGIVRTDFFGESETIQAMVIDGQGRIIAVGESGDNYQGFAVARYLPNGLVDLTFAEVGWVTTSVQGEQGFAYPYAAALDLGGNILVAGRSSAFGFDKGGRDDFTVVRYTPDGLLDDRFADAGVFTASIDNDSCCSMANRVEVHADGTIEVSGTTHENGIHNLIVLNLDDAGLMDSNFGDNGLLRLNRPEKTEMWLKVISRTQEGGWIAVGKSSQNKIGEFAVVKYQSDGALDKSFNQSGYNTTPVSRADANAYAAAVSKNGKIILAGSASDVGISGHRFCLTRYWP